MTSRLLFVLLALSVPSAASASIIAIIDSGMDYKHKDLVSNIYLNPGEIAGNGVDDDKNGYVDDVYGWNFAENNNQVIDYKYIGTFSQDPYKFFDIQTRSFEGTATDAEKAWVKEKIKDDNFIKELEKFGNFVHGTHVTGCSVRDHKNSKAFAVKLIATEPPGAAKSIMDKEPMYQIAGNDDFRIIILNFLLTQLAGQQMKLLTTVGQYVAGMHADVANGSFGTGFAQAQTIVGTLFKTVVGREPTPDESKAAATSFMNAMIEAGKNFVGASPGTLFVFAAGNDGADNDAVPTSPTNIKADNELSVAATYKNQKIAFFSNYGAKMVDVAAPGVGIYSTIPGDDHIRMSGTSQATPYVTNVAGEVKSLNPKLIPSELKKIIMGTVDAKDWLKGKIVSEGTVNPDRAYFAARASLTMSVEQAIATSKTQVKDMPAETNEEMFFGRGTTPVDEKDIYVLPLPSMFQ